MVVPSARLPPPTPLLTRHTGTLLIANSLRSNKPAQTRHKSRTRPLVSRSDSPARGLALGGANPLWAGLARCADQTFLSLGILLELFEHAIQFGLSLDYFARLDERLELLLHDLADGRWIAPAGRPFVYAHFHAVDFFSEALARRRLW